MFARIATLVAAAWNVSAWATSATYEVTIRDVKGKPCFSVQADHLRDSPHLVAVEVTDASDGKLLWRQYDLSEQNAIAFAMSASCILYGRQLQNVGSDSKPPDLQTGRRYAVGLNTDVVKGNKTENRRYAGFFCVTAGTDRKPKVQQVRFNSAAHEWDWSHC